MLDELVACLEQLKKRIGRYGSSIRENETRTRMQLIDPLLRVLGWDVSDPEQVTPEFNVSGSWADYALLQPDGKPTAIIEAKKLDENLSKHRMQMLTYATASGIAYAGLSDGNHWELYRVFEHVPLDEKKILDVSITEIPPHKAALDLLLLWRPNLESGDVKPASEPILAKADEVFFAPASKKAPEQPLPDAKSAEPGAVKDVRPDTGSWIKLLDFKLPPGSSPKHASMKLWDGRVVSDLKYWNELLFRVVEKLYRDGLLTVEDVPVATLSGRKNTFFINTEPIHGDGRLWKRFKKIPDSPLFVFIGYNWSGIHQTIKFL